MSIILLGDIAFNGLISDQPEKNTERFSIVAPILQEADLVFANLETPIKAGEEYNNEKSIIHYASYEVAKDLLAKLNIGCVSLANNHIYDCKMDGLKATINLLDELGIYHTGAGWKQEHIEPVIIEKEGQQIGFLAYVDKSTNPKTETFPELLINYFEVNRVLQDIKSLKERVDKVICSIHWGVDYSHYPTSEQVSIAHRLVDAGADIIMGHHPHTIQPYEVYKGKHIFYSLGGICFGDFYRNGKLAAIKRKTKLGMIAITNKDATKFSFIPTKDLPGNRIIIPNLNLNRKLNWLRRINKASNSNSLINSLVSFKEAFIDRIFEYFFGYYRNPLLQLFEFRSIKKFGYMIKDYKKIKQ